MKLYPLTFPKVLPIIAIVLSVLFWLLDSVFDLIFFARNDSVIRSIFQPEVSELWIRILVVVLLLGFSIYVKHMLTLRIKAANELSQYKDKLEELVAERTNELQSKNEQLQQEIRTRAKAERELQRLAATDPLTLLYNRRKFNEMLEYEINRETRYQYGLALILCDIDYFKIINDKHGHGVGDVVLKEVSIILKNAVRKTDVIARWGGEEFIFLLPNATPERALEIANKIRQLIEAAEFPVVNRITASLGVAFFECEDDELALIKRADQALYRAKKNGRNLVEFSGKL